jgi:D-arabinose 1-dehydrogenase-like Zn-dependent alcohol dehydrogenase
MRAIVLQKLGGPEELELRDVPEPEIGPEDALVRVGAEGVCGRDLIDRRGGFRWLKLPVILGHEFAGEVVRVGSAVQDLAPGDRVSNLLRLFCGRCAACLRGESPLCEAGWQSFGQTSNGGYAELVAAPARALVKVPPEVSDVEAASLACTAGVSLRALRTVAKVQLGDWVLVTGASGGVGMAAVQIAKRMGARVIATTTNEKKAAALKEAGADEVVASPDGNFHARVKAVAPAGVDVALELTGSATFNPAMRSLKGGGKLVLVGNILTEPLTFNPGAVILFGYQILGSAGCTRTDLVDALELVRTKALRVTIDRVLPLDQAAEAHRLLADRGVVGRVILTPR